MCIRTLCSVQRNKCCVSRQVQESERRPHISLRRLSSRRHHFEMLPLFLPPEGEVLNYLARTLCETIANVLKYNDLHRHIIYQNDPMAKPDFMVMVPDLYRRRRRHQARRGLPSHPPEPQGHLFCAHLPWKFSNMLPGSGGWLGRRRRA